MWLSQMGIQIYLRFKLPNLSHCVTLTQSTYTQPPSLTPFLQGLILAAMVRIIIKGGMYESSTHALRFANMLYPHVHRRVESEYVRVVGLSALNHVATRTRKMKC